MKRFISLLFLSLLTIGLLTACSSQENQENTTEMDELASQQMEEFEMDQKTFDVSSEEVVKQLKNSTVIAKTSENNGTYTLISEKNLIKTYLSTNKKKTASINLTLTNTDDKQLIVNYFQALFDVLEIDYDEEKLLSLLDEKFSNTADIKNTDYKHFNYNSDIWFRMVGLPNQDDEEGHPTGLEINISRNEPDDR